MPSARGTGSGALPSASAVAGSGSGSVDPSGSVSSLAPASGSVSDAATIPGTWTIGADSVVGYRVRERLANLSADSDAVGRTDRITGSATISAWGTGLTVTAAEFSVEMKTITSDRLMRDDRLRTDGIQTDSFPTSTFTLTEPAAVPVEATSGGQVDVTLHGDLTLRGVTKTVDIPAKAQLSGGRSRSPARSPSPSATTGSTRPASAASSPSRTAAPSSSW